MNVDEIDKFLSLPGKTIPAAPAWRDHTSRVGEMKSRIGIAHDGAMTGPEIELTIRLVDPGYVAMVLIVPTCVSRLCIGTGHRNRITGDTLNEPHFHRWSENRHLPARTRETLPHAELLPQGKWTRDAAFVWFLGELNIESPHWLPVTWPGQGVML